MRRIELLFLALVLLFPACQCQDEPDPFDRSDDDDITADDDDTGADDDDSVDPGDDDDATSSPCIDDGQEPNDELAAALPFSPGTQTNLTVCRDSEDWWALDVVGQDDVGIVASFSHAQGDIDIALYEANGVQMISSVTTDDNEQIDWTAGTTETVYLQVQLTTDFGLIGGNEYDLSFATSAADCTADSLEPNDSQGAATPANPGNVTGLRACPLDGDWFEIAVGEGDQLDLDVLFNMNEGNIDAFLTDAAGSPLAESISQSSNESITWLAPSAQTVFLQLVLTQDFGIAPGVAYELQIDATAPTCPTDAFEPNDALSNAAALTVGLTQNIHACADDDYFFVPLASGQTLNLDALFAHAEGDLDLALYDSAGVVLTTASTATDDESLTWEALASDDYVVQVMLVADAGVLLGNPYELDVNISAATCLPDPYEPNDNQAAAVPMPTGSVQDLTLCPTDDDWYSISLTNGDQFLVSTFFAHAEGDIDIALYDDLGNLILGSTSLTDDESIAWNVTADGDYFVEVSLIADTGVLPGNVYDLDSNLSTSACPGDGFEPNDGLSSATGLTSGAYPGLTACNGEEDWFAILAEAGDVLTADAVFSQAEGDIDLSILDDAGVVQVLSNTTTDDESATWTVPTDGTVYVQVLLTTDLGASPGNVYDLTIGGVSPGCVVDSLEPNDSQAASSALSVGSTGGLWSCASDEDWYVLNLAAGDVLTTDVLFDQAEGDIDIELFDPSGASLAASATTTSDESLTYTSVGGGAVFLQIGLTVDSGLLPGNPYEVVVDIPSQICAPDAFEPNDEQSSGSLVAAGTQTALTACALDEDWFAIGLLTGEQLTATALFSHAEGDINLSLWDSGAVQLVSASSTTDDETASVVANSDDTYFVQVTLANDTGSQAGNSYDLDLVVGPAVCAPDGFEPNDSQAAASPVGTGPQPGLTVCPTDEDWYEIPVAVDDWLVVDATFNHNEGDLDLNLFDAAGTLLTTASTNTDDEQVSYLATAAGAVYLQVELVADAGLVPGNGYDLDIAANNVGTCVPDGFEPNDIQADAVVLPGLAASGLTICPQDDDWFFIALATGDTIDVEATFAHAEGDIDLNIYDFGGTLHASGNSTNDDELVPFVAPFDGSFFLQIELIADLGVLAGNTYDLSVSSPNALCEHDGFEPNDALADATALPPGTYLDNSVCPADVDWFAIDAVAGEEIQVAALFSSAEGNIDLTLHDAAGTALVGANTTSDNDDLNFLVPTTGTWFLRAFLAADAGVVPGNTYDLTIGVVTPTICLPDGFEPNEALSNATPLPPGTFPSLTLCPPDEDWYSVSLAAGDSLDVLAGFSQADGDVDLNLYDGGGILLASANSNTDDELLGWVATGTDDYFLQVEMVLDSGDLGTTYDLDIAVTPAICLDDVFEPNDLASSAAPIGAGLATGLTLCPGDDDWYSVNLSASEVLTVDALFAHAEGDIDLQLFDPAGGLLLNAATQSDDEALLHTAATAGDYVLHVALTTDLGVLPGNGYDLDVFTFDTNTCTDDGDEDNDTQGSASALAVGLSSGLVSCPLDEDWYAFTLTAGDTATVDILFPQADGDLDAFLYDPAGTLLDSSTTTTNDEQLAVTAATSGQLFVQVVLTADQGPNVGNGYDVDLTTSAPQCPPDFLEPNDSVNAPATVGPTTLIGLQACPLDEDWLEFDALAGQQIQANATFLHAEGDVDMNLYDGFGNLLATAASVTDDETLLWDVQADGTFRLQVLLALDLGSIPGNPYDLAIATVTPVVCPNDPNEPNEAQSIATPTAAGTYPSLSICPPDEDWYGITSAAGDQLTVDLTFFQADGDLALDLYDPGGALLASVNTTSDNENLTWTVQFDGVYYARVHLIQDFADAGVQYDLTVGQTPALCGSDAFEPNDSLASPSPIIAGAYPGLSVCPTDDDWYSVLASVDDIIDVEALFSNLEGDLDLELFDPSGTLVADSATADDDEALQHLASTSGAYVLHVALVADTGILPGNTYDLTLQVVDTSACTDDGQEENDSLATAAPLNTATLSNLASCPLDEDWFFLPLTTGQDIDVDVLFAHADGDIDLTVYDASGQLLVSSNTLTDDESVNVIAPADGDYFVAIELVTDLGPNAGNTYDLSVSSAAPLCLDDFLEPNDVIGAAANITPTTFVGLTACAGDEDWFSFDALAGEQIQVNATFANAEGNLDLILREQNGNAVASSTSTSDNEGVVYDVPADGTFYAQLILVADAGPLPGNTYDLAISVVTPVVCPPDGNEPNEAQSIATAVGPGSYPSLSICPPDEDWFGFTVQSGDQIDLDLTFFQVDGNLDLELYDGGGILVASATSTTDDEVLSFVAQGDDTYAARVVMTQDFGDAGAQYDLTLGLTPAVCAPDAFEPNDTLAAPATMLPGSYPGLTVCPTDDDYFAISLAVDEIADIALTFDNSEGDLDITLYDPLGSVVAESLTSDDDEAVQHLASIGGTFILEVLLISDTGVLPGNVYDLDLVTVDTSLCTDDAEEDNDAQASASPIQSTTLPGLASCPLDEDWYFFELAAGQQATVDLTFVHSDGDIDLALLDDAGNVLATSTTSTSNESATITAAADGTYYAQVTLTQDQGPNVGNDYDLDLSSPLDLCLPDLFESNDSVNEPAVIQNSTFPGLTACPADEDWFSISAATGEQIQLTAAFPHAEGDIDLFLYEINGNLLASSSTVTDDEDITYDVLVGGDFYVQVVLVTDTGATPGNAYDLSVGVVLPVVCQPDVNEPNESQSTGTVVGPGSYPSLNICPPDEDWFEITAATGDTLDLDLTTLQSDGDLNLELYDSGGLLLASATSITDNESLSFVAPGDDSYALRVVLVQDFGDAGAQYDLDVAITPAVCNPDAFEPNETLASPSSIAAGSYPGLTVCPTDVDVFAIALGTGELLDVQVLFADAEGDLDITLYDSAGTFLVDSISSDDDEALQYLATAPDTFLLEVVLINDSGVVPGNVYDLDLTVVDTSLCADDSDEENDTQNNAAPLTGPLTTARTSCPLDEDWFFFAVSAGDTATVDILFANSDGDLDVNLYDELGNLLDASATTTDDEQVSATALADANLFVQVVLAQDQGPNVGNAYDVQLSSTGQLCIPDFLEPNDSINAPAAVTPTTFPGLQMCPADEDWFQFDALAGQQIQVTATFPHAEGDIDLELYELNGNLLDVSTTVTDNESIIFDVAADGTFYLAAVMTLDLGVLPGNPYDLAIGVVTPVVCPDDIHEPNEAQSVATPTVAGTQTGLSVCPPDDDWYAITAAAGDQIDVTILFDQLESDLGLELFDSGGALLASSNTTADSESLTWIAQSDDDYSAHVYMAQDFGDAGGQYELTVGLSPAVCSPDAFEPNDSQGAPAPMVAGDYPGLTVCPTDDDWFALALDVDDLVDVQLLFSSLEGDLDLALYDPSGALIIDSTSADDDESLQHLATVAGTHTLEVSLAADAGIVPGNTYSLELQIVDTTACSDDSQEDNDVQADAAPISSPTLSGLQSCPLDDDWFFFPLAAGQTADIDALFAHSDGDVDLFLYDAAGSLLASSSSTTDNESVTASAITDEDFFVEVVLATDQGPNAGNAYDLSIASSTPLCIADFLEPNDAIGAAANVTPTTFAALTACPGDEDWFAFDALAGQQIQLGATFSNAEGNLDVVLYEQNGNAVASATSNSDDESLQYDVPADGTFYAQVILVADAGPNPGNTYDFAIGVITPVVCPVDGFEPNDAQSIATGIGPGTQSGLTICPPDEDWLSFPALSGDTIDLDITFFQADGNLDLELYDGGGLLLASANSVTDDEFLSFVAQGDDTYAVRVVLVQDFADAGAQYDLTLALTPAVCSPDGFEPNDAIAAPAPMTAGSYPGLTLCPTDDDYFAIDLIGGEIADIALTFANSEGDIDAVLYDPFGTAVADSLTGDDDEALQHLAAVPGTYVLEVLLANDFGVLPGNVYDADLVVVDTALCTDDAEEDNDSQVGAAPIAAATLAGLASCPLDEDWYFFPLSAGQQATVDIAFSTANGDLDLALYDDAGTLLGDSTTSSDDESVTIVAPADGSYFAQVVLFADAGPDVGNDYDLTLSSPADLCLPDFLEPNDSINETAAVQNTTFSALTACPADEDWFQISALAGEQIQASIAFPHAEGNLDFFLYELNGNLITSSTSVTDDEAVLHDVAADGDFFLQVVMVNDTGVLPGNVFDLAIGVVTPVVCPADGFEPNEAQSIATPIAPGNTSGVNICPPDEDWFEFSVATGDTVAIDALFLQADADLDLEVYDSGGALVASATSNTDNESLSVVAQGADTWALRVFLVQDFADPGSQYEFDLTVTPAVCTPDAFEPNDALAAPSSMAAGSYSLSLCPTDDDYFGIALAVDELLDVQALFDNTEGDLDLALYDPSGTLIVDSISSDDDEAVQHLAATAGTYVVEITLVNDFGVVPGNTYDLDVVIVDTTLCTDDAQEDNDLQASASPLAAAVTPGLVSCPLDEDWHFVTASAGDAITLDVTFSHADGDLDVEVYDELGLLLDSSSTTTDDEQVSFVAPADGAYFLRVLLTQDQGPNVGNGYAVSVTSPGPLCTPDFLEPNDSINAPANVNPSSFPGLQLCPGDEDWFQFDAVAGDQIQISADFLHAEGDVDLNLYEVTGNLLATASSVTDDESLVFDVLADGTFLLQALLVVDLGSTPGNAYDLGIGLVQPVLCSPDGFEPNEAQSTAAPVAPGSYVGVNICPPDEDWYEIATTSGDVLDLSIVSLQADADLNLELYDPGGVLVASSTSTTDDEAILHVAQGGGGYALRVVMIQDFADTGAQYQLDVAVTAATCTTDVFEPNDSQPAAAAMVSGSYSLSVCPTDDDWFAVAVSAGDIIDVQAGFAQAEGDIDIALYDPSGTLVADSATSSDDEALQVVAAVAGTFTLEVALISDLGALPGNPYDLDLTVVAASACTDDIDEDNDSQAAAAAMTSTTLAARQSCPLDPDWYVFPLSAGDAVTVSAAFAHSDGDVNIAVYDAAGGLVGSSTSVTDDESVAFTTPATGDYFVEILLAADQGPNGGNAYDLSLGTSAPLCTPDLYEPNNSLATAGQTTSQAILPGLTLCPAGEDWYSFDALAGEQLQVSAVFPHAEGNIDLVLYDGGGNPIADALSTSDDESLTYDVTADGTFFVQAVLVADTGSLPGNTYDLSIGAIVPVACPADIFEINDGQSLATPVGPGNFPGLSVCTGDEDWFGLPAAAGDTLDFFIDHDIADANLDLFLWDSTGGVIALATSTTDDESLSFVAPVNDTYALQVVMVQDFGDAGVQYELVVGQTAAACATDGFEPNDTQGSPAALVPGSYPGLAVCPTDDDWFEVILDVDENILVQAEFSALEGDIDIALYDPTGTLVAESSINNTFDEAFTYLATVAGAYTLEVALIADAGIVPGNEYDLNVVTFDTTDCLDDSQEDNDSQGAATPISNPTMVGLNACPFDEDWYFFEATAGQSITVDLAFAHANGDLQLELLDETGAVLSSSLSSTDDEAATVIAGAAGDYYARVFIDGPVGGPSGVPYDLTLSSTSDLCIADLFESNDELATATPVSSGTFPSLTGCPLDEDWFLISALAGEDLQASIDFVHAEADLDLFLYEGNGNLVASSTSLTDNEALAYTVPADDDFFVQIVVTTDFLDPGTVYDLQIGNVVTVPCSADIFEPNESQAAATPLTPGAQTGLTVCPPDEDWYSVTLTTGDLIQFIATFDQGNGDLDLSLFDSTATLVDSATSNTSNETITFTAPADGTYSLQVAMTQDFGDLGQAYDLSFSSSTAQCTTDAFEPNNTQPSAAAIPPGVYSGLAVCPTETDWFAVSLALDDEINAVIDWGFSEGDLDLALYDPSVTLIDASTANLEDAEVSALAGVAGTWYLEVTLVTDLGVLPGTPYNLDLQVVDTTLCTDDGFEDNDVFADAAALGSLLSTALVTCPLDDDWYWFELPAGESADITAFFSHVDGDIDLTLYDAAGTEIDSSATTTDDEAVTATAAVDSLFYVEVTLAEDLGPDSGNTYDLELSPSTPLCFPDSLEPNDTQGTAAAVSPGSFSGLRTCPADEDWLSFFAAAGEQIQVTATFSHAEGDIDISLFDAGGTLVEFSPSTTDDEGMIFDVLASGTYAVQVELVTDTGAVPGNSYALNIAVVNPVLCSDDAFEPNGGQPSASPVAAGTYNGLTLCDPDEDWFEVSGALGEQIDLDLSFQQAEADIDVFLYDAGGAPLGSATSTTDDESLSYVVQVAGLHYAQVVLTQDFGDPGTQYDLTVGLNPAVCQNDPNEPNDTDVDATVIVPGSYPSLNLCPADEDWFAVELGPNDLVELDVVFAHAAGDIDVTLYDATLTQVADASTTTDNEFIGYTVGSLGTHYIQVVLISDAGPVPGNAYTLDLAVTPPGCPADWLDPNDSFGDPYPLPEGTSYGLTVCPLDEDWYVIDVYDNSELAVDVLFDDLEGELEIQLFDSTFTSVGSNSSSGGVATASQQFSTAETAYVQVYSPLDLGAFTGTTYDITLDLFPQGTCIEDAFEPDNGMGEGAVITTGAAPLSLSVCDGDEDWFLTTLQAGETLQVDAGFLHAEGNLDLFLFDLGGGLLAGSTSTDDNEVLTYTAGATDETVHIQAILIQDLGGAPGNTYFLEISGTTPMCVSDYLEPNNLAGYTSVGDGAYPGLTVCEGGDVDEYLVVLQAGQQIQVDLTFLHVDGDLNVVLKDPTLVEVDAAQSTTDNETFAYTATTTGIHRLEITLNGLPTTPGVAYDLDVVIN